MYLFGLISGSILLALIFHDAFEVMLLPRRVRRKLRFITLLFRYTWNLMVVARRTNGVGHSSRYVSEPLWTSVPRDADWLVGDRTDGRFRPHPVFTQFYRRTCQFWRQFPI